MGPFQISVWDSVWEAFLCCLSWYPLLQLEQKCVTVLGFVPLVAVANRCFGCSSQISTFSLQTSWCAAGQSHAFKVKPALGKVDCIRSSPKVPFNLNYSIIYVLFSFVSVSSGCSGTFPCVVWGMLWIFLIWLWEGWHGGGSFPLVHHSDFGSLLEWETSKNDDSHKYIFLSNVKRENQFRESWTALYFSL